MAASKPTSPGLGARLQAHQARMAAEEAAEEAAESPAQKAAEGPGPESPAQEAAENRMAARRTRPKRK